LHVIQKFYHNKNKHYDTYLDKIHLNCSPTNDSQPNIGMKIEFSTKQYGKKSF